ncbi:hypothetical protein BAE44_0010390 [Dichanthelium oligosanthes]|uniref:Phytosulfokine n=1 Tax=Dichanthelium oligosanthes TaxID=888268 RepID=A0A1E5VU14_9POAL|nr:hypothetical protein BAE44_0010390 [Dichanthelium oligosanthes]
MARAATVMVLAVLLLASSSASVASAGRAISHDHQVRTALISSSLQAEGSTAAAERGCEGANDEDECMMRRTLAVHTDYIYTQQHHN